MNNHLLSGNIPVGFGMALAQNPQAMSRFALMNESEQQRVIDGTHQIHSRQEMHAYVRSLGDGSLSAL